MTDIITPQAGWYPDPTDSRAYRWWSGGAWTEHLTAAPSAESVWSSDATGQEVATGAGAFDLAEQSQSPFSSSFENTWASTAGRAPSGKNRTATFMIVIGLIAVAAYLGSLALNYSTIIPLIPGVIGLICAVPAFRRARVTGDGLPVSLLGVLLSGAASVLAALPLLPLLLGVPTAADINDINQTVAHTVAFHSTVEKQLITDAQKTFGKTSTAAACPSSALPIAASTFSCSVTLADGTTGIVNVTVTNDTGAFTAIAAAAG